MGRNNLLKPPACLCLPLILAGGDNRRIYLCVSVVWKGDSKTSSNIKAERKGSELIRLMIQCRHSKALGQTCMYAVFHAKLVVDESR
jgi:hypothetical protein